MPADNDINVFMPRTLGDLLALKSRKPEVTLFAGGSYLLHDDQRKFPALPESLASIRQIDELQRIHRTERYLEVGSCVSLAKIADIGGRVVPGVLADAIAAIATPPVRNVATIGGNISVREQRLSLFPVLFILDTRVELRELGGSRWVPINRLLAQDGDLDISPTEIVTRVRIPLGEWDIHRYRALSTGPRWSEWDLSFCGLAHTDRDVLSDFRFAFGSMGKTLVRNREIEAELVSRKLPLPDRDREAVCQEFDEYVSTIPGPDISENQINLARKLFRWFIVTLDPNI